MVICWHIGSTGFELLDNMLQGFVISTYNVKKETSLSIFKNKNSPKIIVLLLQSVTPP